MGEAFAVFDFEATDWVNIQHCCAVLDTGEVLRFRTADEVRRWLSTYDGQAFAHYGGRYDFLFLMPLQNVKFSSSRAAILSGQLGASTLRDSSALFPCSVKDLGVSVGLEKFADRSGRIEQLTPEQIAEHAERDCRIVQLGLLEHREWCEGLEVPEYVRRRWPTTAGSTAVYVAECLERETVKHLAASPLEPDEWWQQKQAVQGGRSEVWRIGRVSGVYAYDVRSAYPASWLSGPVPVGPWRLVHREIASRQGVYRCAVVQGRRSLPVVAPHFTWRYDGECWLTTEEIAAVREAGGTVKVQVGWVSAELAPFGQKTIRHVYPFKGAGRQWAKGVLNGLHGKLVQELVGETFIHTPQGYVRDRELTPPRWFQRPLMGAVIYARARLRLWRTLEALRARGWRVYYCDTDSVHTDCPPAQFPEPLGLECGSWRLEHGPCEAVYVAPKVYGLRSGAGETLKIACRSIHPSAVSWEALCSAAAGEGVVIEERGGLVGFRQALADTLPRLRVKRRTIRAQLGGKRQGKDGWLRYADAGAVAARAPVPGRGRGRQP